MPRLIRVSTQQHAVVTNYLRGSGNRGSKWHCTFAALEIRKKNVGGVQIGFELTTKSLKISFEYLLTKILKRVSDNPECEPLACKPLAYVKW